MTFNDPREELDLEIQSGSCSRIIKIPAKLVRLTREMLEQGVDNEIRHPVRGYGDGIVYVDLKTFAVPESEIKGISAHSSSGPFQWKCQGGALLLATYQLS